MGTQLIHNDLTNRACAALSALSVLQTNVAALKARLNTVIAARAAAKAATPVVAVPIVAAPVAAPVATVVTK